MRRFAVPLALVLVAAVIAGCGGENGAEGVPTGSEEPQEGADAYVEQARAAGDTIRGSAGRLSAGTTAAELEEILADVEAAVRRLEQATPPYDLLPEHQELTQGMWDAVDAGHGLATDADEVAAADLAPVVDALDEAAAALDEMEEKGYEVRRRT